MQVLPELIRTLNNGFLKTQVRVERKINQCQSTDEDVRGCVEWGANLLLGWLEENQGPPTTAENTTNFDARRKFRRCVLAVIAMNRLRRMAESRKDLLLAESCTPQKNVGQIFQETIQTTLAPVDLHHGVQITSGL
jgi:hypothetical protein